MLRAAELRANTDHLQDTHWNARGTRVAGDAIADFILNDLDRGTIGSPRADTAAETAVR